MNTKPCIAFLGDLTVDKYIKQKEIRLGGSSLTGAMWARRLGAQPSIIAAVGDDYAGKEYISMVTREYIDQSHVAVIAGKTSSIEIYTTQDGERVYGEWYPGVLALYRFSKKDFTFMRKHDAVVLTAYNKTQHLLHQFFQAFASKRKKRFLRIVDFGDVSHWHKESAFVEKFLKSFDIAVFGLDKDIDQELINELRILSMQSGKLFVVTLNKYGAAAFQGIKMWGVPGQEVPVVDTIGAGDAFLAAFLVSLLKTKDIQKSLEAGSTTAARVIQKVGAY